MKPVIDMPTRAEFAAERSTDQDVLERQLFPHVSEALQKFPAVGWYDELLAEASKAYLFTFHDQGGTGDPSPTAAEFVAGLRETLDKTEDPDSTTTTNISTWLATAILNAGTQAAVGEDDEFVLEWVTMHDSSVREAHRDVDGQTRAVGEPFLVDGVEMAYPGDSSAPIDLWINCRCGLRPKKAASLAATIQAWTSSFHNELADHTEVLASDADTDDTDSGHPEEEDMTETETEQNEQEASGLIPWHGVLAPEGKWSGDGRMFEEGSLSHRDLPLPLTWQKTTEEGHNGSVTVADIQGTNMIDGEMCAWGHMLPIPEADEVLGLIAHFGKFGVSVDADDAEMAFDEDTGKVSFSKARVCSASIVSIPAFAEAYVKIGEPPAEWLENPDEETEASLVASSAFVSDKPWSDFTQADYTDQQWKSACVLHVGDSMSKSDHKLPIKEPGGALNRNGVHAAAARFNQVDAPAEAKASAKSRLRGAYKALGEEVPDVLKASAVVDTFGRGPGWITDPVATKRIHDYWTKPGEEGYIKLGWGTPGDFNRCRIEVGAKIAENSPEDIRFLNAICAQWHHDATGFWPGDAPAERATSLEDPEGEPGPAVSLVASGGWCAPSEWFRDPEFTPGDGYMVQDKTGEWIAPMQVEDGRVFGHLAGWRTCHVGYDGVCVAPPRSNTEYAYFLTSTADTTEGRIPAGHLTIGGGHAAHGLRPKAALAHYDDVAAVVADITVGEDDYGIWYSGAIRPNATEDEVEMMQRAVVSGDWRRIAGDDALIAALAVNTGGFPIPRVGIKDGEQVSLVAAGAVAPQPETPAFDMEKFAAAVAKELRAQEVRRDKMAALAQRVNGAK